MKKLKEKLYNFWLGVRDVTEIALFLIFLFPIQMLIFIVKKFHQDGEFDDEYDEFKEED